jgi:hypothetical protein
MHTSFSARCDGRRRDVNVRPRALREHPLPMMREVNAGDKLDQYELIELIARSG